MYIRPTFPLRFDVVLHIEVQGDVSTDSSRPVLSNVRLCHFNNGEGHNGLCHSSPSPKHYATIFGLPTADMEQSLAF